MKVPRVALFFSQSGANATLSYQHGWPRAFAASDKFDCRPFNLSGLSLLDRLGAIKALYGGKFDAIVLLHSVFSNQKELRGAFYEAVALSGIPKVFFISNEYKPGNLWRIFRPSRVDCVCDRAQALTGVTILPDSPR